MSTDERAPSIAHYRFLPWVRQGFQPSGRTDAAAEAGETVDGDASTAVTLTAQANEDADGEVTPTDAVDATVDLRLYGPGDVVGIDHRQVVRTEPTADTPDFLPNRFPFVEFDRPDLPWLFSPVGPDDDGRLRPWCVLVVVRQQEGVTLGMEEDASVPVLEITTPADLGEELPPLRDAWAWAHVQVLGDPSSLYDDEWLQTELAGQSDATVARLLAPRKLASGETYHACVVPAYEAGRLAGLGAAGDEATAAEFAWGDDDATVRLPVYHRWEFSTGRSGDFEALARRLDPTLLPPTVGSRDLDVSDPGPDAMALAGDNPAATLELGGALTAPERDPPTYDPALQATLSDVLNAPATATGSDDDGDATPTGDTGDGNAVPVVGPPTYGEWHVPVDLLGAPGAGTDDAAGDGGWVRELNLNPHHRAAAGFGTRVVQGEQEELMASAWAQLGDIRRANRLLRAAQRSREASRGLHADLFSGTPAASVGVTGQVHTKIVHDGRTVAAAVDESRLPATVTDPAFRRLSHIPCQDKT